MEESFFKVTGHTIYESNFTPSRRTDYELLIGFESSEANRKKHENFLSWYRDWDEKRDGRPYHLFNHETCAVALATFYLREGMVRLLDPSADRLIRPVPPDRAPDFKDAGHRLWVIRKVEADIYTESNAGWDLYARCRTGKIEVSDARALIADKFGSRWYSWADVLHWFRKNGGRHTDKYLRVDP